MISYGELFVVVMALMLAGTRLALARPARRLLAVHEEPQPGSGSGEQGWGSVFAGALALLAAATLALTIGSRYVTWTWWGFSRTICLFAAVDVAFVVTAARSRTARTVTAAVAVACSMAWLAEAGWLTYSLAAGFAAFALVVAVQPGFTFRFAATAGLIYAFGYDLVQVFFTRNMLRLAAADPFSGIVASSGAAAGKAARVVVAAPAMIGVPAHAAMFSQDAVSVGIGDLVIPGILIVIAARAGKSAGTRRPY